MKTTNQGPKPRGRRKKIRTEPIRPICPQCEKQFSNQSALTKHKLTHSDERKFACQQCSKAFKRHDHLTGHMQTHSNRKPFNCTIQGCDKTYCDARSLRRHKENIHHIVTPKETGSSNNNNNNNNNSNNQHQLSIKAEPTSCITSSTASSTTTISTQKSNFRRRFQRLNSDPGGQFDSEPSLIHEQHQSYHMGSQTPQLNPTHHHQHLQHQQAPFSADYASTQHFFDFNQITPMDQQYCNGNTLPNSADSVYGSSLTLNGVHYENQQPATPSHVHHPQHNHRHHQNSNNSSGYITPTTLHPPTPTILAAPQQSGQYTPNENQTYQQQQQQQQTNDMRSSTVFSGSTVHHQPSQLFCKRMERLRSDPGAPYEPQPLAPLTCRPIEIERRTNPNMGHQANQHNVSYSADYASTQHFLFDFDNQLATNQQYCETTSIGSATSTVDQQQSSHRRIQRLNSDPGVQTDESTQHYNVSSHTHAQLNQNNHQQAPFSADYASTQQFFDFNQTNPMDQQNCNGGILTNSADSVYDSSFTLNSVHYEQHQPTTPTHTMPQHNQQQQQQPDVNNNNSSYITPTAIHPPTPTMLAPQQSDHPYTPNEHQSYQPQQQTTNDLSSPTVFSGTVVHNQQSQLLHKRKERLRSDSSVPHESALLPPLTCQSIETERRSLDSMSLHSHLHSAPYSADYASSQHFSFDFNHQVATTTTTDQQYCNGASAGSTD